MSERLECEGLVARLAAAWGFGTVGWRVETRHDAVGFELVSLTAGRSQSAEVLTDAEGGRVRVAVTFGDRRRELDTDMDDLMCDPDLTDCVAVAPSPGRR